MHYPHPPQDGIYLPSKNIKIILMDQPGKEYYPQHFVKYEYIIAVIYIICMLLSQTDWDK